MGGADHLALEVDYLVCWPMGHLHSGIQAQRLSDSGQVASTRRLAKSALVSFLFRLGGIQA